MTQVVKRIGIKRRRAALSVVSNEINIDWANENEFLSTNRVVINTDATFLYSNTSVAEFADILVEVNNLATLTFQSGTISPDGNFDSLVWTPPEDGKYSLSLRKAGSEYSVLFTQAPSL